VCFVDNFNYLAEVVYRIPLKNSGYSQDSKLSKKNIMWRIVAVPLFAGVRNNFSVQEPPVYDKPDPVLSVADLQYVRDYVSFARTRPRLKCHI
jgi:hypothetical protein